MRSYLPFALAILFFSCSNSQTIHDPAKDPAIGYCGRTIADPDNNIVLIGSASYVEFNFTGDSCVLSLKNITAPDDYNYVVAELDNKYTGRIKIEGHNPKPYTIKSDNRLSSHLLRLFKATESHNGQVVLIDIKASGIKTANHPTRKKIEFIGNSITAGMGNDIKEIPCGTGKWYDQHNAYMAYGPRVARALDLDFMISAVSGIGIYRNWNSDGPTMPQVYESTYLEIDSLQRWDFNRFTPDVVSICLGTNDFSDGDGKTKRLPFDSTTYIKNYVDFIGTVYKHYPSVQIALLTSPMLSGNKSDLLFACLQTVQAEVKNKYPGKPSIEIFRFNPMVPKGCGYHPDLADHETMANELIPFFRKLLGK